ncbi:MAG: hypothetical protein AAGF85_00635 [Bacteroidota bacterium]
MIYILTFGCLFLNQLFDFLERKKTNQVDYTRGWYFRIICAIAIFIIDWHGLFAFGGIYLALYNPTINLWWAAGGWLKGNWFYVLAYIGRTADTDKLWWKFLKGLTIPGAFVLSLIIGATIWSVYAYPGQWIDLWYEITG